MRSTIALLSLLLLTNACSGGTTGTDSAALSTSDRADEATSALVARFFDGSTHYFNGAYPSDGSVAGYWIYAQAFDAVLTAAQRTDGSSYRKYLTMLYDGQAARGWQSDFFDDESWMALALIRAYDVSNDHTYLDRAEALFADIDQNGRTNDGVWWNREHVEKATASNFGPALVAARLNERTGNDTYKQAAQEIYDYWYSTMVDRTTFQVADHIDPNGDVAWSKFTYNTGLAIGASIELWNITNNHEYLSHAYSFGTYLVTQQVASSSYGNVLHDDNCTGDCDAFKGVAYRNLAKLFELDTTQSQYGDVLVASANAIWGSARDTKECVFGSDWTSSAPAHVSLGADASAVIALNVAAADGL
jgi:predicted alpha-1,6-mannanase (GH76 family)